ncbi:MAG TPA: hypothetical protein VN540_05080 [Clostridia bacterium]|nr:hypothetical protein [Clostridia bacterium]
MFRIRISPLTREMLSYAQYGAPERQALISIMDHKRDCTERYPAARVLRLCFDDATDTSFWTNLMTQEQADAIRDFVLRYVNEIDLLIVHCTGGVSRSAAVAAAVLAGLGESDARIWNDENYRPNPLVYRMVLRAFGKGETK